MRISILLSRFEDQVRKTNKQKKNKKNKKKTVNRTYLEVKLGKIYTESNNAMQLLN